MKVKVLINDSGDPTRPQLSGRIPRWKVGEIGELLENDYPKYDFKVLLPGKDHIDDLFGHGPVDAMRIYYFYKDEVELLKD